MLQSFHSRGAFAHGFFKIKQQKFCSRGGGGRPPTKKKNRSLSAYPYYPVNGYKYLEQLLPDINKTLFKIHQGFALSLLDSKSNAGAAEFSALVEEVEAQFKLLKAYGDFMGI